MFQAVGTISSWASVVVAGFALYFAYKSSTASRQSANSSRRSADAAHEQIAHRNEKERQEQASKVAGWISASFDPETMTPTVHLHYVNANELPAYNFVATLERCHTRRLKMRILAPTDGVQTVQFPAATDWLKCEIVSSLSTYQPLPVGPTYQETARQAGEDQARLVQQIGLSVQFQDSYGAIWHRSADGTLKNVDIDYDRGWKGTVMREQAIKDEVKPREEHWVTFDILATSTQTLETPEMIPNMKEFGGSSDGDVDAATD